LVIGIPQNFLLLSACGSDWIEGDPAARRCQEMLAAWWHRGAAGLKPQIDRLEL
jgi:hypothetical protein